MRGVNDILLLRVVSLAIGGGVHSKYIDRIGKAIVVRIRKQTLSEMRVQYEETQYSNLLELPLGMLFYDAGENECLP